MLFSSLLSGSAIRYRFYSTWGLSKVKIASIIAFGNLSFWLGMLAVGGVLFLIEPLAVPDLLNLPFASIHSLGAIFLALAIGYLLLSLISRRKTLHLRSFVFKVPSFMLSLAQITVSTLDWAVAAGVLYVLLNTSSELPYPAFFGVYLQRFAGL